jgi:hypothetical protein
MLGLLGIVIWWRYFGADLPNCAKSLSGSRFLSVPYRKVDELQKVGQSQEK